MNFEIINLSDLYMMYVDDLQIVVVVCCFFGDGKYGFKGFGEVVGQDVLVFLFGGYDEWFMVKFGMNFEVMVLYVFDS